MSQESMSPKTFIAGEALEAYRRVKLDGAGAVVYADAGEAAIGITTDKVASAEPISVALISAGRSFKLVAAGPIAANAVIYGANDGKVDDAVSGNAIGVALEACAADLEVLEGLLNNGAAGNIGANLIVNDEANAGALPIIIRKLCNFNGTPDPIAVATATRKLEIIDWYLRAIDNTAANITVKNAGTSISTAALAKGATVDAIVRGVSIVEAQKVVAAGAAITVESSAASADIVLYLVCLPIA